MPLRRGLETTLFQGQRLRGFGRFPGRVEVISAFRHQEIRIGSSQLSGEIRYEAYINGIYLSRVTGQLQVNRS